MSGVRLIIRLPTLISSAFHRSIVELRLCSVQGTPPKPPRTWFTPSCLTRRGPAAGSEGGVLPVRAPPNPPPPSPMLRAIFGVSLPSLGGAGTWAASAGTAATGANAPAPRNSIAVLRVNFMIKTSLGTKTGSPRPDLDPGFSVWPQGSESVYINRLSFGHFRSNSGRFGRLLPMRLSRFHPRREDRGILQPDHHPVHQRLFEPALFPS